MFMNDCPKLKIPVTYYVGSLESIASYTLGLSTRNIRPIAIKGEKSEIHFMASNNYKL